MTLEDVLEEILQAEIVDESDVVEDNVSKRPVAYRREESMRRMAWHNMLDPSSLKVQSLNHVRVP